MSLFELVERPDLDSPVVVLALEGWIDAGLGAAQALATILESTEMETVAVFDSDALLDHRARRPTMHLVDGVNAGLSWPSIELRAATDQHGHEALFLLGAEPDHRWRAFSRAVVDLALEFGSRLVVGLGAYPAPVPHTRPTRLVSTATSSELAELVGFVHGRIDVPAGVHAAIERRCADVGIPAVGLWAQVPHYAAAMPYPAASLALIEGLARIADLSFDTGALAAEAASTRDRLDALVANSEEHVEMVRQLEHHVDTMEAADRDGLPTGDELAAELERFLREQD
ncbi:MAG: PAC2 family protein [Acidimicrobiales bacterium]|jgi:proteasome assembly chaperone (PAC2) family protein